LGTALVLLAMRASLVVGGLYSDPNEEHDLSQAGFAILEKKHKLELEKDHRVDAGAARGGVANLHKIPDE
jgi:hypothetical protein